MLYNHDEAGTNIWSWDEIWVQLSDHFESHSPEILKEIGRPIYFGNLVENHRR